jgi:uncharacterized iron-regulated membrane protein
MERRRRTTENGCARGDFLRAQRRRGRGWSATAPASGAAWQIAIFLGGLIPALLSVTGTVIWWRFRAPRARAAAYRRATA